MVDSTVILAFIGLLSTVFVALFKLLNDNTKALNKVASSSDKVATETAKGNREAKQRNGHLGEQNIQITRLIADQGKDIAAIRQANQLSVDLQEKSAKTLARNTELVAEGTKEVARVLKKADLGSQVVDKQTVVHQTVKSRE